MKFHVNTRRNPFFTVRVIEHWNRFPREVVVSILRYIERVIGHNPDQPALVSRL